MVDLQSKWIMVENGNNLWVSDNPFTFYLTNALSLVSRGAVINGPNEDARYSRAILEQEGQVSYSFVFLVATFVYKFQPRRHHCPCLFQ